MTSERSVTRATILLFTLVLIVSMIASTGLSGISATAQSNSMTNISSASVTNATSSVGPADANPHFENTFQQRLGSNYTANLIIIYQSPEMVVLKGDLVSASPGSSLFKTNYNNVFWHGIEILRQEFGFTLDKLVVNGFGSVINPERMYAVMVKNDVK